jgi:hypothetical protein
MCPGHENNHERPYDDTEETAMGTDGGRTSPTVMAAVGSVALALYYYYLRGDKQRGQFVGLWPATILGLATYVKLDEITSHAVPRPRHFSQSPTCFQYGFWKLRRVRAERPERGS